MDVKRPRCDLCLRSTGGRPIKAQATQRTIGRPMPTLFRFLMTLLVLAGIGYGAMYALVLFVEPNRGEMTVRIPPERLQPQR